MNVSWQVCVLDFFPPEITIQNKLEVFKNYTLKIYIIILNETERPLTGIINRIRKMEEQRVSVFTENQE